MKNQLPILLALLLIATGCTKIANLTDSIVNTSAREKYKRDAKINPIYNAWEAAYTVSLTDSVQVKLPYFEKGTFVPMQTNAYSYTIALKEGEVLNAIVHRDSMHHKVFVDLFEITPTGLQHIAAQHSDRTYFELPVDNTGNYKLIIQPELAARSNFIISVTKKPLYGFPVAGKGNAAIQSFWGYDREGGKRKHEGVDIFAKRGTPVVAAADGYVTSSGEKGIGGKQVWMRTSKYGSAVYYAHLDSIISVAGTQVRKGDTLGLIGNTGNAKGGPPHLHFGIYKNGAVDPLPFIFVIADAAKPDLINFSKSFNSNLLRIKSAKANLRLSPSTSGNSVGTLLKNQTVTYLGEHREWIHIKTETGQSAFLHKSLISVN